MYTNTIRQAKCSSFNFSGFFRGFGQGFFGLLDSFEKARKINQVAVRNPYDQEALRRTMFED